MNPTARAAIGLTNPDAGVMPTKPATAPELAAGTVGLPCRNHSTHLQPSAAAPAPKCVATNALEASLPAETALPALKPNQPTHSRQAPVTLITRLCGAIACLGNPIRLPR